MNSTVFDHKVCHRCGGKGIIDPFRHIHKGVCFGCGGTGYRLTAHGKRDHARYRAAVDAVALKTIADVKEGDFVRLNGDSRYARVTKTAPGGVYWHIDQATGEQIEHRQITLTYDRTVVDLAIEECAPGMGARDGITTDPTSPIYISAGEAMPKPADFVTPIRSRKKKEAAA